MANASVYMAQLGTQWTAGRTAASLLADWNAQWALYFTPAPVTVAFVALNATTNRLDVNIIGTDGSPSAFYLDTGDWVVNCYPVLASDFPLKCSTAGQLGSALPIQQEVAAASIPALLLNGTTSVTATFKGSFPSTVFTAKWRAFAGVSILSTLTVTETSRTASSITYTVAAPGLATAAGVLLVDAYAPGA
jgi:hypothetical protein